MKLKCIKHKLMNCTQLIFFNKVIKTFTCKNFLKYKKPFNCWIVIKKWLVSEVGKAYVGIPKVTKCVQGLINLWQKLRMKNKSNKVYFIIPVFSASIETIIRNYTYEKLSSFLFITLRRSKLGLLYLDTLLSL